MEPPVYNATEIADYLRRVANRSRNEAVKLALHLEAEIILREQELPGITEVPWYQEIIPRELVEAGGGEDNTCPTCARRKTRQGRFEAKLALQGLREAQAALARRQAALKQEADRAAAKQTRLANDRKRKQDARKKKKAELGEIAYNEKLAAERKRQRQAKAKARPRPNDLRVANPA